MGAINYFTSDYITLGVKPYNYSDFESDLELMEEIKKEVEEYGGTVESAIDDLINSYYEDDESNIECELEKHRFYYFHVAIKPGYYEGFTLDIENNFPVAFDGWEDRREAQKEITEIKEFLTACAGMGLVKCSPGWCTGYSDYNGTIQTINAAIKEMREEVRTTPTWLQYNRA